MAQAAIPVRHDMRDVNRIIVGSLLLLAALAVTITVYRNEKYGVAAILGLAFLVGGAWRAWLLPFLYLGYLIFIPRAGFELELPFYYHINTFLPSFAAMVILLLAERTLDPNGLERADHPTDYQGVLVALLLGWFGFTYLHGMAAGNSWRFMFWEIGYSSVYFSYFFWRAYFRRHDTILTWNWIILVFGLITAALMYYIIVTTFTDIVHFVLYRTLNPQPQITMITLPLSFTLFLTRKSIPARIVAALVVLFVFLHVFLSQQRSVWVASAIISFVYFTLYIFRWKFSAKKVLFWLLLVLLIAGFFVSLLFIAGWILHADLSVLLVRWQDVQNMQDPSFQIRVHDFHKAIHDVGKQWYWGLGGGKLNNWVHTGWNFFYFDNSYGLAYYKGGIPLVLFLVLVYLGGLYKHILLFLKSRDVMDKLLGITFTATFVGLLFMGFFNSGLMFYRFIFVWMMLIAMSTVMLEKIERKRIAEVRG